MATQKPFAEIRRNQKKLRRLTATFKTLGDVTRTRIICLLAESEYPVGTIAEKLGISESLASKQLRILRDADLVQYRRAGKSIFYELDDDHIRRLILEGLRHVEE